MSSMVDMAKIVRELRDAHPAAVPVAISRAASELGATDVVAYLADFAHEVLEPIRDSARHAELPHPEAVAGTLAGRAFIQRCAVTAQRPDGVRVWVPIIEGSDSTGVLALTLPAEDERVKICEDVGVLSGYLIATQSRVTDIYNLHRRRKELSLAASMQWDLLPPLGVRTPEVECHGMVEPAYEVGGDCFDFSLNETELDLAVFDSMGHGAQSAMLAALAVGAYRHARREGRSLLEIHQEIDAAIGEQFDGEAFVTGVIARLDVRSGRLSWLNAGHPLPLLFRHGHWIGHLHTEEPALPWGLGAREAVELGEEGLEPGDTVVLYTDGVVDRARTLDTTFSVERLADLTGRYCSEGLPVSTAVRMLIEAVLEHHGRQLRDDATLFMTRWHKRHDPLG
jgi:serine phosphatase RsbU (regulator of sigma subunit)